MESTHYLQSGSQAWQHTNVCKGTLSTRSAARSSDCSLLSTDSMAYRQEMDPTQIFPPQGSGQAENGNVGAH